MIREKEELLMCTFFLPRICMMDWWCSSDKQKIKNVYFDLFAIVMIWIFWRNGYKKWELMNPTFRLQTVAYFNIQHNIGLLYKRRKSRCHRGQLQKIICTAYVAVWWPIPNTNNKLLFRQREIKYPFLVFLNYDFYRRHEIM